ncbi:MAG: class I SAM-dependent methyltransferase [Chthoniobacterales bacterium]|nr:class I SAM-dependent methyltransferase [Chthoniobacterales bacterium]
MITPASHQQKIWEEEHKNPHVLLPMDSREASHGVSLFWNWLREKKLPTPLHGLEMGCGKGRNSIWLATQGVTMTAFDFSRVAIEEAKKRSLESRANQKNNPHFYIHDATQSWPLIDSSFDFAIDCFASTDIDSLKGRACARDELLRVLKPNGYLLVYTLSTEDAFHQAMRKSSPALEKNSFFHPSNGKFEKVFEEKELEDFYREWKWVEKKRIQKTAIFLNKEYSCSHFWIVLQKKFPSII